MRIFQILEFNQFNTGSVHQMFQAAVGLRERGHDVTIVSRPDSVMQEKSEAGGVTFVGLPMRSGFDLVSVRDWKGWKEVIDAVAALSGHHSRVHLALIGSRNDEESAEVRAYARDRVRLSTVEYREDMPNVFASCDLVVDASWAGTGITG